MDLFTYHQFFAFYKTHLRIENTRATSLSKIEPAATLDILSRLPLLERRLTHSNRKKQLINSPSCKDKPISILKYISRTVYIYIIACPSDKNIYTIPIIQRIPRNQRWSSSVQSCVSCFTWCKRQTTEEATCFLSIACRYANTQRKFVTNSQLKKKKK